MPPLAHASGLLPWLIYGAPVVAVGLLYLLAHRRAHARERTPDRDR